LFGNSGLGFLDAPKKNDEEYTDTFLKYPKAMKEFFLQLTNKKPNLLRKLKVPCIIANGLDIELLVMDAPEGYVCRVTSTEEYSYPSSLSAFITYIVPCLKLVWSTRSIMEEIVDALIVTSRINITMKRKRSSDITSCFSRGLKKPFI
jgi:hypothetical protein